MEAAASNARCSIDMTTVHFCTPEEVNQFVQKGWITAPTEGNEPPVNLHVFREYALKYISNHPEVNHNLMQMVRQLQPTTEGIPVEIYCFSNTPDWIPYETLQGEIFDHLIAMIPGIRPAYLPAPGRNRFSTQ